MTILFLFYRDKEILASYIRDVESALGKVGILEFIPSLTYANYLFYQYIQMEILKGYTVELRWLKHL